MTRLKLISNPYEEETKFEIYDEISGEFKPLHSTSYDGELINEIYKKGFFPFNVKKILELIYEDFSSPSDLLTIEFQGTKDEFDELKTICEDERFSQRINLEKSHFYLENARDILPDVIDIFQKLYPLVENSILDKTDIKKELDKFSEASGSDIPIYVLGNFSSGKSTFINSLVGYEFLPSSAKPTTAKIYKIKKSKYKDRAKIDFSFINEKVSILFDKDSCRLETNYSNDEDFIIKLRQCLENNKGIALPLFLGKVLEIINTEANINQKNFISDLIQLEIPFEEEGIIARNGNRFVIFDTPGSDAANNGEHLRVLRNALEGLSNGLPVIVSEYESLDRVNADELANEINSLNELDNRFTMIVVNKADCAKLNDYSESDILDFAVPQKLYASGIYFLSSLIGLGSKNNQEFIDEYNAEIFSDQKNKYLDKNSNFYKKLYDYNILPQQIKNRYHQESERSSNLLFANSGLQEVEQAIIDFADIYSPYNKCQQSKLFLNKIITFSTKEITEKKYRQEQFRENIYKELEKGQQELISQVINQSQLLKEEFINNYSQFMENSLNKEKIPFEEFGFDEKYQKVRSSEQGKQEVLEHEDEKRNAKTEIFKNVRENWKNIMENLSKPDKSDLSLNLKKMMDDFINDTSNFWDKYEVSSQAQDQAENFASDNFIQIVSKDFTNQINESQKLIETESKNYWESHSEIFKKKLSKIVTESDVLTIEEREEIKNIIIQYSDLIIEDKSAFVFDKEMFRYKFWDPRKINTRKLAKTYNEEVVKEIDSIFSEFEKNHKDSFEKWSTILIHTINDNIVDFNPKLHEQSETISDYNIQIKELENRIIQIENYSQQIKNMMVWKINFI
ncbi:MAG: dynamin family protein [Streptococcus sp.]|nr:dynamin family protein [Streptococcus sp.]